ncbi:ParB/RepB/Spo0J family partition protein [Merdibacter massiliensis]|uniref:ParB/RepB/Spo0J family partition protein n=1 Tax=Merdibacter massiliensis TaxID=1871030 RepID=UPI00096A3F87|nr:ParB/RepB/Spo0J family partition protein [Merdibacter massiliensis]
MSEIIQSVNIKDLIPFKDHPFKLRDGEEKEELMTSIKSNQIIEPLIVRPVLSGGKYEVISGHRRLDALKGLGINEVPVIVKNLSDEEAIIMMVDSNLKRENILPSEKAYAYKMKLKAFRKQNKDELTLSQLGTQRNDSFVANQLGIGKETLHRYIRLTYLIPELLKMVDDKRIAITPAVELSYLKEDEQFIVYEEIYYEDSSPSLSQAQRLKTYSKDGLLDRDKIYEILSEAKGNQKEVLKLPVDKIKAYRPKASSHKELEDFIIKACAYYQRYLERQKGRDR